MTVYILLVSQFPQVRNYALAIAFMKLIYRCADELARIGANQATDFVLYDRL